MIIGGAEHRKMAFFLFTSAGTGPSQLPHNVMHHIFDPPVFFAPKGASRVSGLPTSYLQVGSPRVFTVNRTSKPAPEPVQKPSKPTCTGAPKRLA
jgi:hypothetical protein